MNLLIRKLENHFPAYETNIPINLCPKNYLPDFAGICYFNCITLALE